MYDLLFDLAWTSNKLDITSWLNTYVNSRYGQKDTIMQKVWSKLKNTVYNSTYGRKDPPLETIFCARPAWNKTSASTWGEGEIDYNRKDLEAIWKLSMNAIPSLQKNSNFQYDMVNITRQVLANYGRIIYQEMQTAYEKKDIELFEKKAQQFLELIKDQDRLLSSREEFMLGPWLETAKSRGNTKEEKQLYEFNARTLITTWNGQSSDLNDYSCREWSGLLKDYYLVRWEMFVNSQIKKLKGQNTVDLDFFAFEKQWASENNNYPLTPMEQPLKIVQYLFNKYKNIME
nr:alpha-N-acetylglucosaminidase C-terminal domain-containing protein [Pedobacter aquae]